MSIGKIISLSRTGSPRTKIQDPKIQDPTKKKKWCKQEERRFNKKRNRRELEEIETLIFFKKMRVYFFSYLNIERSASLIVSISSPIICYLSALVFIRSFISLSFASLNSFKQESSGFPLS